MISHVSVCLLAHEEKGLISNTFCHAKREYSFSVHPIGCTPAFSFCYHQITLTRFCCLNRGTNCTSVEKDFHSIFSLGLDRKGWIAAAVGVVGMCVNCQDCEAVGKLFAGLWEKACLFPSGCEWFFHRHERQFSIFP